VPVNDCAPGVISIACGNSWNQPVGLSRAVVYPLRRKRCATGNRLNLRRLLTKITPEALRVFIRALLGRSNVLPDRSHEIHAHHDFGNQKGKHILARTS